MKKDTFRNMLLTLALMFLLVPLFSLTAFAEDGSHEHDGVTFQPWTSSDSLPDEAGNYYLTNDVKIPNSWIAPSGTHLCLNGHGIILTGDSGSTIIVEVDRTMNLYDCNGSGKIHYYTVDDTGLATVNDQKSEGAESFEGGYITGGKGTVYEEDPSIGGGIALNYGALDMTGGTVIGNTAEEGGGVCAYGNVFNMSGNATVIGNTATRTGGGVCNLFGIFHMSGDASIIENSAETGGGVYCYRRYEKYAGLCTMSGNATIAGNKAEFGGGAAINRVSVFEMSEDALITQNDATEFGGGVHIENKSSLTMDGGAISENTAGLGGGGLNIANEDSSDMTNTLTIKDGSITDNTARLDGGGINMANYCTLVMTGGSILDNSVKEGDGGAVWGCGTAAVKISGAPMITGNKKGDADSNVYLEPYDGICSRVVVDGALTKGDPGKKIGIAMVTGSGVFTDGWSEKMGTADPADYFASDDPDYDVARTTGEHPEAQLIKHRSSIAVNAKTVSAKTIDEAIKKAGVSKENVTTITIGKKVKKISAGAFRNCKSTRTLVVKTKKLKKSKVKNSLKGSAITKVKVQVGSKKANKKYVKKYKKIFTKKNAGKKVRVSL